MRNKNTISGSLEKDRRIVKRVELVFQATQNQASNNEGKIVVLGFKQREGDLIFCKSVFCSEPRVSGKRLRKLLLDEARHLVRENQGMIKEGFTMASKIVTPDEYLTDPTLVMCSLDTTCLSELISAGRGVGGIRLINDLYGTDYRSSNAAIPEDVCEEMFVTIRRLESKGLVAKSKVGSFWYMPFFEKMIFEGGHEMKDFLVEIPR